MAFVSPKPGGWNAQDKLTSAQMNALQVNIADADAAQTAAIAAAETLSVRAVSLGPGNVQGLTTFLNCTGTYTIPANTLGFTGKYRAQGVYQFSRGSTATALNLITRLSLGAGTLSVTSAAAKLSLTFQGAVHFIADFGMSGVNVCNVCLITMTNCDETTPTGKIVSAYSGSFALNVAIDNDIKVEAQMSAAVSQCVLFGAIGDVERRA